MACPWCTMPGGKHDDECPYEFAQLQPETIILSAEDYDALAKAIENPTEPNENLKALMRRKPIWET